MNNNYIAVTCKDCGQTFHGSMEYESTHQHHHHHHHETSSNQQDHDTMFIKPTIFSRVVNTFWKNPFGSVQKPETNVNQVISYSRASSMSTSIRTVSSSNRSVSSTIAQYSGRKRRFELSGSKYPSFKRVRKSTAIPLEIPTHEFCQAWINSIPENLDPVNSLTPDLYCKCKDEKGELKSYEDASCQTS